ncbi:DEAD/DEAH box helicase [Rhodococcus opacus]|uniref:DEAD/DEAH box helicase n=1 Tax=Rhodococcus opacus TaxID=37919 RepID=UPI0007CD8451|nr:DEAD/DEAH box helicase [Rhodococcus opacus]MDX5962288.1 DEAD/DEAH box helicase [Rhodococcus opacus]NKY74820.1 DEAD/DEAH box helicase [Rhodococcus opacus]CAG7641698.1 hypothetical protein E143388_08310 [Rhodococcus opacus]
MDVFGIHEQLIADYRSFTTAAVDVRDPRIKQHVEDDLARGEQWPEPWLSLNPTFASGGTVGDLVSEGLLHAECERIFRVKRSIEDTGSMGITLHRHQRDAVEVAASGNSYVLTTGTGSGKSLAYIVPIVDRILRSGSTRSDRPKGVKAIIVYPMNALANSQVGELEKFLRHGYGPGNEPVTFARYTGQERGEERDRILADPPDILLTNYVMLELVLTRPDERRRLVNAARDLQFLVLDELHTYRGRQGADVAMLVRRVRDACQSPNLQCVGTSATMASGGSRADQVRVIAAVATELFGAEVTPDRVIGETLDRATTGVFDDLEKLRGEVRGGGARGGYESLTNSPLAAWVETTFGLATEPVTGRLIRQDPIRVGEAAARLAEHTALTVDECERAIRATLLAGSRVSPPGASRPLFAFRLHQFLSKGDTVHVSIENERDRHITSTYQVAVPGRPEHLLMPLAFCRECGQEYLVVSRREHTGGVTFGARRDRDASGGDFANGYLYISEEHPWPFEPEKEGRLPDSWVEGGDIVDNRRKYLPRRIRVDATGMEANSGGTEAAFVPAPFTFCLRCRTSYEQIRGQDFAKLATLDAEGRSSAVSVISASIVRALKQVPEEELSRTARKLLTFVDNRQDASLQAGHFNDFVSITQLRGALFQALCAHRDGVTHADIGQLVVATLGLEFADYAANPEAVYGARKAAERAFQDLIEYRIYTDLQRGWRVTMPNLEQTGLLRIDYESIAEIAADDGLWSTAYEPLRIISAGHREEICRIVLDEFRRGLAIDVDCLTEDGFERLRRQSSQHLQGLWSLPYRETLPAVGTAFTSPGKAHSPRSDIRLTARSALGRYLRQPGQLRQVDGKLDAADSQRVIEDILRILEKAGLLTEVVGADRGGPGYRLKASAVIWQAGDGQTGARDPLRKQVDAEQGARVNVFFRDLYSTIAPQLRALHAAEHTAQVSTRDRELREHDFRAGDLPLMYCSPTMELGVDIADLNAVALRNTPPTPANYAQRSGRAGRSGQPALVVTYCATGNAHDQYYFRRSADMVAGAVAAPRLDLTNEALLVSHLHAIWLAETSRSLESRMIQLLDVGEDLAMPLREDVRRALADPDALRRATRRAEAVVAPLLDLLSGTSWWTPTWVADVIRSAPEAFDRACDRWRELYRAATADQKEQNRIVLDNSVSHGARRAAESRRRESESQLRILRNEDSDRGHSDFYTYRYFASEGFLPGYSFPRLPLAAYIPGTRSSGPAGDGGDYLQRPRFLAISEFGPGALIYHEGARYEVNRVQVPMAAEGVGSVDLQEARRCAACGYHHVRRPGLDTCEHCGTDLGAPQYGLMRLQTVFTRRRERISSDEEERRRAGFELETSFRFSDHGLRSGRLDAEVSARNAPLATLSYGDTATVRVTNVGRRRRKDPSQLGYLLDTVTGRWLADHKADDAAPQDENLDDASQVSTKQKVIPFVEDTRNIAVLRLADPVDEEIAVSLRYALERGIEAAFELEDSELSSEELPDTAGHGRMLFTESAEGGAGVLRRLQSEADALAVAARTALAIAHFDPDTGADLGHAAGARERCERACYDCLLSYGNQYQHERINRHAVRDLLMRFAAATTISAGSGVSRGDQVDDLRRQCTSTLEHAFIDLLAEHGFRMPDAAQTLIADASVRPDFVYRDADYSTAIFVDGPVHDDDSARERDTAAEDRLLDAGWSVLRFRHDQDWLALLRRNTDVFGKGRM